MSNDSRDFPDITPDTVCQIVSTCVGYYFKDPTLPLEALTHRSHFNERPTDNGHNERLEFLGDAVLDLIIAETLMRLLPLAPEGQLTLSRSTLVNEETLAAIGQQLRIGDLLLLGRGEEKNNGRAKPSILSDAVEALAGAIYLDSDFDTTKDVVLAWFSDLLAQVISAPPLYDTKSELQERMQSNAGLKPIYSVVAMTGPDHEKTYEVEITVNSEVIGRGTGRSKKDAEKTAARNALDALEGDET